MSEFGQSDPPMVDLAWRTDWPDSPLEESTIDVWRIHSDNEGYDRSSFFDCLSTEEIERANRFHFERDRRSFRVTHACKREILGRYCHTEPRSLQFVTGRWGKPMLSPESSCKGLSFNLSHSKGMTLVAVTRSKELGVDVESSQSAERMEPIFRRFASDLERAQFEQNAAQDSGSMLTSWWVCKEAFLKTVGRGLSLSLSDFSVMRRGTEEWGFEEIPDEFGVGRDFILRLIAVGEGHRAAVAMRADGCELRAFEGDCLMSRLRESS